MKALPILAIVLLLIGGGGYFLFGSQSDPGAAPDIGLEDVTKRAPEADKGGKIALDDKKDDPARTVSDEGDNARTSVVEADGAHPQGVEGLLVSNKGGVLKNAEVHLVAGISPTNMLAVLTAMAQRGGRAPANVIRSGSSDTRGFFRLDCPPTPDDAPYELRVVAKDHVLYKQSLRVVENQWKKLGTLTVERGIGLAGVVRDAATKQPVAGATVRLMPPSLNAMSPTPGLEDGYECKTDARGNYAFSGLPSEPMQLSAFAKGYGSFVKTDLTIENKVPPQREDIELPKGFEISGFIVDADGNGIPRARVEATPLASQNPTPGSTFSDQDGAFTILGLTEGQFIVSAQASGYSKNEKKPVASGASEIAIPLERQCSIRAVVKNRVGRPVRTYTASILRFYPENPEHFGKTNIQPARARSKLGECEIAGIDPGHYVVQIDASGYAKTFSKHVEIREGSRDEVRVDITLSDGGTLFGVVVDAQGKAVPNATVETKTVDFQDNPIFGVFASLQPKRITEISTTTDKQGRFKLEKLAPSTYQLRVVHAAFARGYFKQYDVAEGEQKDVGRLQLKAGVIVKGTCRVGGRPGAGVEIQLSRVRQLDGTPSTTPVFEKVFANTKGEWRSTRALSEGIYEVQASRVDLPNPLMKIVDIQHSKREVRVVRGMPLVLVTIPNNK